MESKQSLDFYQQQLVNLRRENDSRKQMFDTSEVVFEDEQMNDNKGSIQSILLKAIDEHKDAKRKHKNV